MIYISACVVTYTPTDEGNKLKQKFIKKELERKITYVEKHCLMNNSLHCKQKWMQIKKLHNMDKDGTRD